jgi:hypothetical protein
MNLILQNNNLTTQEKKLVLKEFLNKNRSILSKADGALIVRLTLINAEEFEKQILNEILLPSKIDQLNNLKKLADKYDPKEIVQKKENSHPDMKSKYMDVNNT